MIITCENCSTSFNLDEKFLKPSGSKVRCSKCKHIFTAFPAAVPKEKEAPPEEVPVDEPESAAEEAEAPDMAPAAGAAVAGEDVQEEAGVDEDQAEDLNFDMDATSEDFTVEAPEDVQEEDLDLTGMGATLDMEAPPVEEPAVETPEAAAEDMDLDAEPAAADDAEPEGLDLSTLDEELDLETEPAEEAAVGEEAVTDDLDLDLDMDAEPDAAKDEVAEELDLSSLDEELDLETGPVEEAAGEEAVTDDLDLDLEMDAEPEAGKEAEAEELDLSALDDALDMDAEPPGEAAAETADAASDDILDDLDLDLEMDAEPEAGKEAEAEELDLSALDDALDMDAEPPGEAAAETADAASDDILDDLDLDLEMEAEPEAGQDADADELDMSDVMFELGDDTEAGTPAEDSELELDLEMEPGVGDLGGEKEDLDMAGFEETLEMDSPPEPQADAGEDIEDLDLDLELEMEDGTKAEAEPDALDDVSKDAEEEIEDLDFELDMDFEPDDNLEGAELELASDGTEDLDMSDIEQMLEVKDDDISGDEIIGAGPDSETEVEKWKDSPGEKGPGEDTAEIDLSDLDLDAVGGEDVDIEDQELDLDLDEETIKSAEAIAAGDKLIEEPEELDISHFEDLEVEDKDAPGVISEGDIELEFEVDEDSTDAIGGESTSDVAEPTQQLDTIVMDAPPTITATPEGDVAKKAKKTKEKKPKKAKKKKVKKTRPVGKSGPAKIILVLLLLLIIGVGAAAIVLDRYVGIEIPYVTEYVKQVPYLNQLMKTDVKKTGEITTSNIKSSFVDNQQSGKLFVISGQVKNEFPESRRFIKLRGKLFASGKTLVKEETVFCGNILTDMQLAQMDLADISKKLSNRFGDNKSNVKVKPGQQLPFMVVFSDFPQDLEEFTIEVAGSSPVQQ